MSEQTSAHFELWTISNLVVEKFNCMKYESVFKLGSISVCTSKGPPVKKYTSERFWAKQGNENKTTIEITNVAAFKISPFFGIKSKWIFF